MVGVSQEFLYVDILVLLKNNDSLLGGGKGTYRVFNKISGRWQKLWSRWERKNLR